MTYPDKTESILLLQKWKAHHHALKTLNDDAKKVFDFAPESPFFDVPWRVFDAYTQALAVQIGDKDTFWMEWYCAENQMGANKHTAGYDGIVKPIESLDGLFELILKGRARE